MTTETITDRFILRTPRPLTDDERRRVRAAYEAHGERFALAVARALVGQGGAQ